MKATMSTPELTGTTRYYAVDVTVTDDKGVDHELAVTVIENTDPNSGSKDTDSEVADWNTNKPDNEDEADEIESFAKEYAELNYSEGV